MNFLTIFASLIIGFVIGFLWMKIISIQNYKTVRQEAVKGSRNAITGEIYEKILPALPNFPFLPKDMVFVGKWVDYIIFDGLSEWDLREIIFMELKSWKARLNQNEKMIKKILENKKVRFSEIRIWNVENN